MNRAQRRLGALGASLGAGALVLAALAACTSEASVGSDARDDASLSDVATVDALDSSVDRSASPVDVADVNPSGVYSCLLRAGPNGCAFNPYREGSVAPVQATIRAGATPGAWVMEVQGLGAVNLGFLLGTSEIPGTVVGNRLEFRTTGTTTQQIGTCTVRYQIEILAQLVGDGIEGTVAYRRAFPPDPECASLGCTTTQDLSGYRDVTADF
ncbi:MAG: hypothetical protein JST00_21085 [Deltaproteobacteria bacterium]|nr:hypothetical protein [Deltaproteobacteria bacterium]